jgi:Tol biopolymer transport system component
VDTNGVTDIFVFDRFSKSIHCLSVASPFPFNQENLPSVYPSISADGQWVAFTSFATNLVPNDTNGNTDIFVVTRGGGLIERVSVGRQGDQEIQADGDSSHPCDRSRVVKLV